MSRRRLGAGLAGAALLSAGLVVGVLATRGTDEPRAVTGAGGSRVELAGTDPVTGRRVNLADFAGKPVLVNVWASWCPGCNDEAADLEAFARAHPEVQVLGVDVQDARSDARAFYRRWRWRHPSISDPQGVLASRLGLQGLPSTFVLDADHRVAARIVGASDRAGFENALRRATR